MPHFTRLRDASHQFPFGTVGGARRGNRASLALAQFVRRHGPQQRLRTNSRAGRLEPFHRFRRQLAKTDLHGRMIRAKSLKREVGAVDRGRAALTWSGRAAKRGDFYGD